MKRGHRLLTLALAAGVMVGCAAAARADDESITIPDAGLTSITDPNQMMRVARERIAAHDLPGAVVALQRYVLNHPDEVAVEGFLGDIYVSDGDVRDAESLYREMISDYPLTRELRIRLGMLYDVEGRTDEAIAQFQAAMPDVNAVYYLVDLHERKGDLAEFRDRTRQFAQDHPTDVDAQLDAAALFGALYLPRDAALEFQRALTLDPNSLEALQGLALAQTDVGAPVEAQQTVGRCLTLDAQNYGCLDALGVLDTQDGRFDDASVALDEAIALAPEAPEALVSLGRLDDARGSWQQAISDYRRAIYVWPYDGDAYVEITLDDVNHEGAAAAETDALKGLQVAPDDARLHYLLGYIYRMQGRRSLALAQFLSAEQTLDPSLAQYAKESASQLQHP